MWPWSSRRADATLRPKELAAAATGLTPLPHLRTSSPPAFFTLRSLLSPRLSLSSAHRLQGRLSRHPEPEGCGSPMPPGSGDWTSCSVLPTWTACPQAKVAQCLAPSRCSIKAPHKYFLPRGPKAAVLRDLLLVGAPLLAEGQQNTQQRYSSGAHAASPGGPCCLGLGVPRGGFQVAQNKGQLARLMEAANSWLDGSISVSGRSGWPVPRGAPHAGPLLSVSQGPSRLAHPPRWPAAFTAGRPV